MQRKNKNRAWGPAVSVLTKLIFFLFHMTVFAWLWYREFNPILMVPYYRRGSYLILAIFAAVFYTSQHVFAGWKIGYYKRLNCLVGQTMGLFLTYGCLYFLISLLAYRFIAPWHMVLAVLVGTLFDLLWTWAAGLAYGHFNPPRQVLLIYGDSPIDEVYEKISSRKDKYEIVERLSYREGEERLKLRMQQREAVILHDLSAELRNHLIKFCYENAIRVYVTPKLYDILIRGAEDMDLFDTPFLLMRNDGLTLFQTACKRLMDLLVSALCLLVLSPIMLLSALLVKCHDGGPVFYRQIRLTKDGKEFRMIKFRSMRMNAETEEACLMRQQDDRITPIGRVLRRTHLDELPQLLNILWGDMSLVGPRPERPEIATVYDEAIPEFTYRLKVKAGLTGYAQVYGKYNSTPYDKLKLDLIYIQKYSLLLDLRLLLLTGKTLFIPDHAEGVAAQYSTALRQETAAAKEKNFKKPSK